MRRTLIVLVLTVGSTAVALWASQATEGGDQAKTIDVVASRYEFTPATISAMQGDTVRLRLRSADTAHGIGIKAFGVKALIPSSGEVVTVEFVAEHAGTFAITCSEYCGTGHSAMKGRLLVLAGTE